MSPKCLKSKLIAIRINMLIHHLILLIYHKLSKFLYILICDHALKIYLPTNLIIERLFTQIFLSLLFQPFTSKMTIEYVKLVINHSFQQTLYCKK